MTEPRIDYLLQRLANMNSLLDMIGPDNEDEQTEGRSRRSGGEGKGKKSGGGKKGGNGGLFGAVMGEMFFRRNGEQKARILGIIHPSDGHPQEELTPDFNWFRPLSYNNPTWTLYWPELIV